MNPDPNDHRIFGWTIATRHCDWLDKAQINISLVIREGRNMEFISVLMRKGLKQSFLMGLWRTVFLSMNFMDTLKSDSFTATQHNAAKR